MPELIPQHIQTVYSKATCLYSKAHIEAALNRLAQAMQAKLADTNPIIICVMKGGLVFSGNLLPRLNFPLELDYIHATRYQGELSGGELCWKVKPSTSLLNRTVLILDDILDEGLTLAAIIEFCYQAGATNVYTAVLINKLKTRHVQGHSVADFVALQVDDRYVFGYGLDYKEYLRNAPGLFEVALEHQ